MPTFSPSLMTNEALISESYSAFGYLNVKFLNSILPFISFISVLTFSLSCTSILLSNNSCILFSDAFPRDDISIRCEKAIIGQTIELKYEINSINLAELN